MKRVPAVQAYRTAYPKARKSGNEIKGPCPLCGGSDRFHIVTRGTNQDLFNCRQCAPRKGSGRTVRGQWARSVLLALGVETRSYTPRQRQESAERKRERESQEQADRKQIEKNRARLEKLTNAHAVSAQTEPAETEDIPPPENSKHAEQVQTNLQETTGKARSYEAEIIRVTHGLKTLAERIARGELDHVFTENGFTLKKEPPDSRPGASIHGGSESRANNPNQ